MRGQQQQAQACRYFGGRMFFPNFLEARSLQASVSVATIRLVSCVFVARRFHLLIACLCWASLHTYSCELSFNIYLPCLFLSYPRLCNSFNNNNKMAPGRSRSSGGSSRSSSPARAPARPPAARQAAAPAAPPRQGNFCFSFSLP